MIKCATIRSERFDPEDPNAVTVAVCGKEAVVIVRGNSLCKDCLFAHIDVSQNDKATILLEREVIGLKYGVI